MALRDIFKIIADENGRISSGKLRKFTRDLEMDISEEEIKEMVKAVQPSKGGGNAFDGIYELNYSLTNTRLRGLAFCLQKPNAKMYLK
jgi:Ca2+-binding EF-hand superfamily protein